jgi:hypothetical protein
VYFSLCPSGSHRIDAAEVEWRLAEIRVTENIILRQYIAIIG